VGGRGGVEGSGLSESQAYHCRPAQRDYLPICPLHSLTCQLDGPIDSSDLFYSPQVTVWVGRASTDLLVQTPITDTSDENQPDWPKQCSLVVTCKQTNIQCRILLNMGTNVDHFAIKVQNRNYVLADGAHFHRDLGNM
jgi:hypothetical protein